VMDASPSDTTTKDIQAMRGNLMVNKLYSMNQIVLHLQELLRFTKFVVKSISCDVDATTKQNMT
jgi:hypothetical protein